jgi:hypothetical protein
MNVNDLLFGADLGIDMTGFPDDQVAELIKYGIFTKPVVVNPEPQDSDDSDDNF